MLKEEEKGKSLNTTSTSWSEDINESNDRDDVEKMVNYIAFMDFHTSSNSKTQSVAFHNVVSDDDSL